MVRAIILVKSPKKLIAARLRKVVSISDSFPTSGQFDAVVQILNKKRKILKQVMIVAGRADISVLLRGNIEEINHMVVDFKKIKDIVNTETLIEVEVNLGW